MLCRCRAQQRSSRDYGDADGEAEGEGEAFSPFFDDEDFFEEDFFVALFSDALADVAPPFLLPLLELIAADDEFWLAPGVPDWPWLHETQSAPAATRVTIDRSDFFIVWIVYRRGVRLRQARR